MDDVTRDDLHSNHDAVRELLSFSPEKWEHFPNFIGIAEFRLPDVGIVSTCVYDSNPLYVSLRRTGYTWQDIGVDDETLAWITSEATQALEKHRQAEAKAAAEAEAAAAEAPAAA